MSQRGDHQTQKYFFFYPEGHSAPFVTGTSQLSKDYTFVHSTKYTKYIVSIQ